MNEWRLLAIKEDRGAMQMAIDEAILIARYKGHVPNTLRFYTWKPAAVTIGYFQSLALEVDVLNAENHGIEIVRRYTGGGAVFHDMEITYSLVMPESEAPGSIAESYKAICKGVVLGLRSLGIVSEFKPINDIVARGRKISGSAQTRRNGIILQHGTLLLDTDLNKMFSVLKVPDEKFRDKMIRCAAERVTSVRAELNRLVSASDAAEHLASGFEQALGMRLLHGELTEDEFLEAEKLCVDKYANEKWTGIR